MKQQGIPARPAPHTPAGSPARQKPLLRSGCPLGRGCGRSADARSFWHRLTALLLAATLLAPALLLTACGGTDTSAASMFLRKTEGTVEVSDGKGRDVAPMEDLGLYSGYLVETQAKSYAWIDLDRVKLTKLDADSRVEITQDGKDLELNVTSGSLFFHVTEPLADDETMEIRTSSMLVGIRGTCGWVTTNSVSLLEGVVSVVSGEQTVTVHAGETAVLTADGGLEVTALSAGEIPAFVVREVQDDETLRDISDGSGIPAPGADEEPDQLAYEVQGTLELSDGQTELRGEEIFQNIVVGEGQELKCDHATIYGDVYLNQRSALYLSQSTVKGNIYNTGGYLSIESNSTVEGDIHLDALNDDKGGISRGGLVLRYSTVEKNIYATNAASADLSMSTIDGYVDVADAGWSARIDRCTVNGRWYEDVFVLNETREYVWPDGTAVASIYGRTP